MNILRKELDARLGMCLEEQQRQRDENLLTRSRLKAQLEWTLERVSLERQQLEERQRHHRTEHALRTKHMEQLHILSMERLSAETEAAKLNVQCKSLELQQLQSKLTTNLD